MSEQEQKEQKEAETEQRALAEQDQLTLLLVQTANLTKVLVAAGISAVLLIAGLVSSYLILNQRIFTVTEGPLNEMTSMVAQLGNDYINTNMSLEFHTHQVAAINEKIESFDPSIDQQKFALIAQVMRGQEQDYQQFLETVKTAIHGLSEMVSGSRSWRSDFDKKLDAAIDYSKNRQLRLTDTNVTASAEAAAGTDDTDRRLADTSNRQ